MTLSDTAALIVVGLAIGVPVGCFVGRCIGEALAVWMHNRGM